MQGHQHYQEKTYFEFRLAERVPLHNFYRRLKDLLDWEFLYEATAKYYGKCGHQSIDPVVFFKLVLVGYLENIASDRKLIEHCSMRLDILYFLGYNLDDPLPWHSTISRTRQLLGKEVFEALFNRIFTLCVAKGLVSGHTQCLDSALIKANASLDSLEEKQALAQNDSPLSGPQLVVDSLADTPTVGEQTNPGEQTEKIEPKRAAKFDRSTVAQRTLSTPEYELEEIKQRQQHWRETQTQKPGDKLERARYLSNKTHYSPTDPDAKIAVKPGKPRQLCYLASLAVDRQQGVITHIQADLADQKDNQCLESMVENLQQRLIKNKLILKKIVADTGYSSGENYQYVEQKGLTAYIPVHGTFAVEREGFAYDREKDSFICPQGKFLTQSRWFTDRSYYWKKTYRSSRTDCKTCPVREQCMGKAKEKKFDVTVFFHYYQRAYQRQISSKGQYFKKLRQSKVEPVLGTLINFLALRRINTRGQTTAQKVMLLSATAFNLKKLLKLYQVKNLTRQMALPKPLQDLFSLIPSFFFNTR